MTARFRGIVWVAVLAACGGETPSPAVGPAVTDSAGVRIVRYEGMPEGAQEPTVSEDPIFEHGHRDGDYLFQQIGVATLDVEGRAVVYDRGSGDLIRIGVDGALDTVLARRGRGPDELLQARALHGLEGGGVLAEDMSNAKMMVLGDGAPPRSFSTVTHPEVSRGLMTVGRDASGALLMVTASYDPRFEEPWRQGHMVRLEPEEMIPDTVAAFDMAQRRPERQRQSPWSAFGRATAAGGFFVSARSDRPELTWRRPDGGIHQIVRWNPEPRYPTAEDWEMFETSYVEDLRRANPQMSRVDAIRFAQGQLERLELRTDEPYPLFGELRGDDEGRVWMGVFDVRGWGRTVAYELIAPDGIWLGRVELPGGFRLLDVRRGRLVGVLTDDVDVERLAVFALEP